MLSGADRRAIFAIALSTFIFAGTATSHADPLRCKREVAKRPAQFAQTKIAALQKCRDAVASGASTGSCPDAKAQAKIVKTEQKMRDSVAKQCGGADRTCGTADDDSLASIGWSMGTCPNFETAGCTNAISNCTGVGDCLACVDEAAVDQAISLYYGANGSSS